MYQVHRDLSEEVVLFEAAGSQEEDVCFEDLGEKHKI
jgi:hypothetical protein